MYRIQNNNCDEEVLLGHLRFFMRIFKIEQTLGGVHYDTDEQF